MTAVGWILISILLLIMLLLVFMLPKQMPGNDGGKRILALSPVILAILFSLVSPKNLMYNDEALSSFIRMMIPFVGMAFSLPLIFKVKKEKTERRN